MAPLPLGEHVEQLHQHRPIELGEQLMALGREVVAKFHFPEPGANPTLAGQPVALERGQLRATTAFSVIPR